MNLARSTMVGGRTAAQMAERFAAEPFAVIDVVNEQGGRPVAEIVSPAFLAMLVNAHDAAALLLRSPELPELRAECSRYRALAMGFLAELERKCGKDYRVSPECWKSLNEGTLFDRVSPDTLSGQVGNEAQVFVMGEEQPLPLEG